MKSDKVYFGFDLLKYLMSLLIVATHSQLFVENNCIYNIASIIYSMAVPTFFSLSTYFYSKKLYSAETSNEAWQICKKDVLRLIILGLFWFIVEMPMTWDTFISIANWKECIVSFLILDPARGLWFIKALIINKIILFVFRNHLKSLSMVSLILFILFSLGYTPLLNNFSNTLHSYFNFYFHTFFCCIGALHIKYKQISSIRFNLLSLFIILIFSWHIYNYDYAIIAWRIISPLFLMNVFLHLKEPSEKIKPFYIFLRKVSIMFYFLHFNFLWIYNDVMSLNNFTVLSFSIVRYIVILTCCFITSIIILQIENNRYFKILRYSH